MPAPAAAGPGRGAWRRGRHAPEGRRWKGCCRRRRAARWQQVSQLLSLSGTTLDLAATLLTVSVVEIESGGGSSSSGGSSGGPGQGSRLANADPSDSADEPIEEDEQASAAIVEWRRGLGAAGHRTGAVLGTGALRSWSWRADRPGRRT